MPALRTIVVGLLPGIFGALVLLTSCAETDGGGAQILDTGRPALHAVHTDRLKAMMAGIHRLAVEQLPQEMDVSALRERKAREVSEIATRLAQDAQAIPDALRDVRINPEDRRVFEAYAEKLHGQATELADIARRHEGAALQAKYDEIISTCNACHSSFRILPLLTRS
ncbi:MAG TPA: cytochrome c [Phycisphaerae bacterium]|nr:cytochrome c [Phycisphaerae bacterium]